MNREPWLSVAERRRIRELHGRGLNKSQIAVQVGRDRQSVANVLNAHRSGIPVIMDWEPAPGHLGIEQREEIALGLQRGESYTELALALGCSVSTVSREVTDNGGRKAYGAWAAHKKAFANSRRPQATKLADHGPLRDRVAELLVECWSPKQISARLRIDFPDDPMMRVSHETIYQSLYVQGRGELRRELAAYLRTGRDQRRPQGQGRLEKRGRIPEMVNISERPAEVADRAVPGHWEGDLLMGAGNHSAIGTLVERRTRYVMLIALPRGRSAEAVRDALTEHIVRLPEELRRTLTWDRGKEMAEHLRFTIDTGVQVYFCDPHSPWQRGSNENTNGLLRQYFPKGKDLAPLDQDQLDAVARELNGRPRQTLGWLKPSEAFAEVVATTG